MLVLSRKESERIRLGDSIVITVVRVSGDKVRLGIDAPPNVLVLREELQPHDKKPEAASSLPVLTEPSLGVGEQIVAPLLGADVTGSGDRAKRAVA